MRVTVKAEFQLFGIMKRENGWYIAYCPPLDITTQGRTEAEAKSNLIEASELFVVSCFERGTFEQAMRELGWQVEPGVLARKQGEKSNKTKGTGIPRGSFSFPVPVPFALTAQ